MIRIERTVSVDRARQEVAKYLSDFRTTEQWDPHTAKCTRKDTGTLRVGSRFVNTQKIGLLRSSFDYEVTTFEPGRMIRLQSSSRSAELSDTIRFEGDATSTTVSYIAEFEFKGPVRFAEPLLKRMLDKIGDDGAEGMAAALQRLPQSSDSSAG